VRETVAAALALLCAVAPNLWADGAQTIRDSRGTVVCVLGINDAALEPASSVSIDMRVPDTPAAELTRKLSKASRDFTTLPVSVRLIPAAEAMHVMPKPERIEPLPGVNALVYPVIDGAVSAKPFVRVTYPRRALVAGVDVVAQRTATATDGQQVVSETRCRITEEIAKQWQ
jgi:hypothetical protein